MGLFRSTFLLGLLTVCVALPGSAGPFWMFPKVGHLRSPDGRFEIRNVAPERAPGDLVGASDSLWLTELSTGRSRKLCDYLGVAAVAWSSNDSILITQYVGKKASRALVFPAAGEEQPVMLDKAALIQLVPVESRQALRENDHLFVEAFSLEGEMFRFRVWGYGKHDPNGFHWDCEYGMRDGSVLCETAKRN